MTIVRRPPDPEIRDYYRYDTTSGAIYWAKDWNNVHAGSRADALRSDGYRYVRFRNRQYQAHRIAWYLVHGEWPSLMIDHIDLDKGNNRLSNLRLANRVQQNANNRPLNPGATGTMLMASGRYSAKIKVNGKTRHIGTYDTQEEAHAQYRAAAVALHGEFARFE